MLKNITPVKEIVYPDNGGYTGFSICVWETDNKTPGEYHLVSPWGSAEGADKLKISKYVLEGRFFVFGSLLKRFFIAENSWKTVSRISFLLSRKWTPIMNTVKAREENLWKEEGRRHIHISEIVDYKIRISLRFLDWIIFGFYGT